jgi:hypothetical protein
MGLYGEKLMQPGYIVCLPQLWLLLLEPCAQPLELCASGWLSACALQPCLSAAGSLAGHVLVAPWQLLQQLLLLTCPWELPRPAHQRISVTADRAHCQSRTAAAEKQYAHSLPFVCSHVTQMALLAASNICYICNAQDQPSC